MLITSISYELMINKFIQYTLHLFTDERKGTSFRKNPVYGYVVNQKLLIDCNIISVYLRHIMN